MCREDNTKYRTSICTDGGEELKQIMRKRSLPRNKVNFTVRRQEMNMMHGFKKMMEVKTQMEGVLGVTMGDDLLSCLDDGIYLCQLINKLQPGVIPVVHTPPPNQVHHLQLCMHKPLMTLLFCRIYQFQKRP